MDRRRFLGGAAALGAIGAAIPAQANNVVRVPRRFFPREIEINTDVPAGQVHVHTEDMYLYWTLGDGKAIRYGVGVGAAGRQFKGQAIIRRKAEWPSWTPTANMIRLEPDLYGPYAAGLPGGHPRNALGSRALYLYQDGRDTLYRIHGTPDPSLIGQSKSSGCVRLINDHINDLYERVPVGTRVFVS